MRVKALVPIDPLRSKRLETVDNCSGPGHGRPKIGIKQNRRNDIIYPSIARRIIIIIYIIIVSYFSCTSEILSE